MECDQPPFVIAMQFCAGCSMVGELLDQQLISCIKKKKRILAASGRYTKDKNKTFHVYVQGVTEPYQILCVKASCLLMLCVHRNVVSPSFYLPFENYADLL